MAGGALATASALLPAAQSPARQGGAVLSASAAGVGSAGICANVGGATGLGAAAGGGAMVVAVEGAGPAIGPADVGAGALAAGGGRAIGPLGSPSETMATGTPITAISAMETNAPSCGRPSRVHQGGSDVVPDRVGAGRSSAPSKRRSAASIAAWRRAGFGGGGSGNAPSGAPSRAPSGGGRAISSSVATQPSPPDRTVAARSAQGGSDPARQGDGKGIGQPYSGNCAGV